MLLRDQLLLIIRWPLLTADPGGSQPILMIHSQDHGPGLRSPTLMGCSKASRCAGNGDSYTSTGSEGGFHRHHPESPPLPPSACCPLHLPTVTPHLPTVSPTFSLFSPQPTASPYLPSREGVRTGPGPREPPGGSSVGPEEARSSPTAGA